MTPPEQATVAAELASIRSDFGQFGRDLGEIKAALAVLVERSNRHEQDVRDLRRETDEEIKSVRAEATEEIKAVRGDVEKLKRAMWTAIGGCVVLGGAAGAIVQNLV